MGDFFKQLLNQLGTIWQKLNITQRIIIVTTAVVSIVGLSTMIAWSALSPKENGYSTLFVNMDAESMATVTESLKEMGVKYKLDNNGKTLLVPQDELYEIRMEMARQGLPKQGSGGYELFDKLQLGMTDFVQNLNFQRAVEGEITRSIQTLEEVDQARVHITIPKPTLFQEAKEEATASVVLKMKPGRYLKESQVRGITHLVANSVEGLYARQVTVLDVHGNMLTKGFADNKLAEQADHNMALKHSVEYHLEHQITDMFDALLGPGKVKTKVSADLDFEKVEKTIETYRPNSKQVRSQQRDEGNVKNNPTTGDEISEGSITNYEIDKTAQRIINAPGTRKRVTISVAVDGTYDKNENGEREYQERTPEELEKFTGIIKNAIGYRPDSEDAVYVTNVRFDREFFHQEKEEMEKLKQREMYEYWGKIGVVGIILLVGFLFLKGLAKNIAQAMNPPPPKYAGIALEPQEEEVPESVKRQNELLERVEEITKENPVNVAYLIKTWLHDTGSSDNK